MAFSLRRLLLVLFAAVALGTAALRVAADGPSFQEIEESLTCQCGCGLTVHSCNHLQCPSALPLRAEIREQLAEGKSKPEILAHFEGKYGEKILSAPTTTGFNLFAWTIPFIVVALGTAGVFMIARRWRYVSAADIDAPVAPPPVPQDGSLREILEREMKDFDA